MKLLHIVSSIDPASGGVAESIRQRSLRLVSLGHEVEVVSLDAPDAPFIKDYPIKLSALGAGYTHWHLNMKLDRWLLLNAMRFDHVVVEGIWQYHAYASWKVLRSLGLPYSVYVHGMLDPWFKKNYPLKHLKKWLFWPWADYRVLRDAANVFFTCEEERRLASQSFWLYRARERVIPFGTEGAPQKFRNIRFAVDASKPARFLFLGRLHEKKGCDLLLRAIAELANRNVRVELIMAGPGNPEYLSYLRALEDKLGLNSAVTWPGFVVGPEKWELLSNVDAFLLPSHQENFGIAVVEAMSCGTPVLISRGVNIYTEVEAGHAGIVHQTSVESLVQALQRFIALSSDEKKVMGDRGRALFESHFSIDAMASGLVSALASRDNERV